MTDEKLSMMKMMLPAWHKEEKLMRNHLAGETKADAVEDCIKYIEQLLKEKESLELQLEGANGAIGIITGERDVAEKKNIVLKEALYLTKEFVDSTTDTELALLPKPLTEIIHSQMTALALNNNL